ncbi:MAG: bifunctional 4-hydroxy-2-oxoglutarate aldolase/2-dehydro-3-deoxy-phosphogluconate aldolase [Acidobacteriota bacterium]
MTLREILHQARVLPVLKINELEHAIPLARALAAGGIDVLEVTLRTDIACEAIRLIATEVPEVTVGAGTVTQPSDFQRIRRAGARFAVSPGYLPDLADAARSVDLPFLPGVMTPTEAMIARDQGFDILKLFPAEAAGGIRLLKAIRGPLPELTFCPTGGLGASNFRDYLELPNVLCVGGSWVAPTAAIEGGDWDQITELARSTS